MSTHNRREDYLKKLEGIVGDMAHVLGTQCRDSPAAVDALERWRGLVREQTTPADEGGHRVLEARALGKKTYDGV